MLRAETESWPFRGGWCSHPVWPGVSLPLSSCKPELADGAASVTLDRTETLGIVRGLCFLANLPSARRVTAVLVDFWHTGGHMDVTTASPAADCRVAVPSGGNPEMPPLAGNQQAGSNPLDRPSRRFRYEHSTGIRAVLALPCDTG